MQYIIQGNNSMRRDNQIVIYPEMDDSDMDVSDYDTEVSDSEDDYEEIYELEKDYLDSEKPDGDYVIGISSIRGQLLGTCITNKTFFKFSYHNIFIFERNFFNKYCT